MAQANALPNILIVEDDAIISLQLEHYMLKLGYNVIGVIAFGGDVVETVAKNPPDLILMDIHLSGSMTGIDAAVQLQRQFDIPIIYLSAYTEDVFLEKAKRTRPSAYLIKPIDYHELRIAIEMALDQHRLKIRLKESEAKHRLLLEHASVGIGYFDVKGTIQLLNTKAANYMGGNPKELVGRSIFELFDASRCEIYINRMNRAVETSQSQTYEDFETMPSGDYWFSSTFVAVKNSRGDVTGVQVTSTDITERKQYEESQRKNLEQINTLLTTSLALNASTDLNHVLEVILTELKKVVPYDSASVQILKKGLFELIAGQGFQDMSKIIGMTFDPAVNSIDQQVLQTRRPVTVNDARDIAKYIDQSGLTVKSWMGVPLLFQDRVVGKLAIATETPNFFTRERADLAMAFASHAAVALEQSRLLKEMQQARLAAEAASRAKGNFLANVSHELRTPLNAVLGYTQILLRDENLSAQHLHAIRTIHRSGEHLLLLINDILDLTKIEAGKMELYPTEFRIRQFLETIVDIINIRAYEKGLQFICNIPPNLPGAVRTDETRLRQILLNLLGNAVKFTNTGRVTFTVTYRPNKQSFEFKVEDTGPGIPADQQLEIFKAFYQGADRHGKGSGLGLAITQHLIRMMDGDLKVESIVGQGSTFWFEVTIPVQDVEPVAPTDNSSRKIVRYLLRDAPVKILLVDDHADNLRFLIRVLEPLGFELITATTGKEAVQQAMQANPDLILMDLVMPHMNGYEATAQIRQLSNFQDVPIIAVSANVASEAREKSADAGCDDYLGKPIVIDSLLEKLETYLELEWVYQSRQTAAGKPPPEPLLTPLPPPVLGNLYDLIFIGDISNLRRQLPQLKVDHPDCLPFINKLEQLAGNFRIEEIETLLVRHLPQ